MFKLVWYSHKTKQENTFRDLKELHLFVKLIVDNDIGHPLEIYQNGKSLNMGSVSFPYDFANDKFFQEWIEKETL